MPSSTHNISDSPFNTNRKAVLTTTALVLALHGLVGVGLMYMPTVDIKSPKIQPPLQISFVPKPKESEQSTHDALPAEPQTKAKPIQELNEKPVEPAKPKMQAKTETKPPIEPTPKVEKIVKKTQTVKNTTEIEQIKKPNLDQKTNDKTPDSKPTESHIEKPQLDSQAILVQQARNAEKIAQQKAEQEAIATRNRLAQQQAEQPRQLQEQLAQQAKQKAENDARIAQEKADRENAAREKADREKADKERLERENAAREKAEKEKKARAEQAQNNQPVSFGAGDAKWKSRPNTNLPSNLKQIIADENISSVGVRLNVSASGSVTSVAITRSSGNSQIDNLIKQRLLSAKFYPFIRNGVAVAGVGNLTILIN